MEAIIYAAGVGRRLKGIHGDKPKILLEFGGRTLLEWHVARLAQHGIHAVTVVTGYGREKIQEILPSLQAAYPIQVAEIHNPAFTEGSVLSFYASLPVLEHTRDPILLMDADVLYPGQMLGRLVASTHPTALLIDRDFSTEDDDPVLVPVAEGRPFELVKQWHGRAELVGESIGFFKVAPSSVSLLVEQTRKRAEGSGRAESYDEVLRALVRAGHFGYEDVTGLPWMEIDFPGDIERARREVWPALERLGTH